MEPTRPREPLSADAARSAAAAAARAFVEHVEGELAGGRLPPVLARQIRRFLEMPWSRQREELTALYISIEEYLADVTDGRRFTRAHLRGIVRSRWRALVELPELAVALADPEEQERRLAALFIERLEAEARPLCGRRPVIRGGDARADAAALLGAVEASCGAAVAERLAAGAVAALARVYRGLEAPVLELIPPHLIDEEALHRLAQRRRVLDAGERFAALRRVHDEIAGRLSELERDHADVLSGLLSTTSQSSALYGALLDTAGDGVLTVDRGGVVRRANGAAAAMWGAVDPAELVGRDVTTLLPTRKGRGDNLRAYLATGTASVLGDRLLLEARRLDDTSFPARVRAAETAVGEGTVFTLVVRDLTDQRQAEARLRLLAAALEASAEAIAITDATGAIEWVNPAFTAATGHAAGELAGATLAERVGLDDDPAAAPWRGERTLCRKDGTRYVARVVASPVRDEAERVVHVVVHHEDISAQRRAQEALAQSEASFRALIDGAPDAIFVVRGGVVTFVNRRAAASLGHADRAALVGRRFGELLAPGAPGLDDALAAVERGEPLAAHEVSFAAGGGVVTVELLGLPLPQGGATAALLFARDITERKRMHEKLAVADRMLALGTLASGVAHEINNPLTYVMVNLEAISDALGRLAPSSPAVPGVPPLGRLVDQAREALEGADRVRRIVRDLHTFARDEGASDTTSDVAHALDACVQVAWTQLRHRARVIKQYGPTPLVPASENRLRQLFLNLIVNAAQAIPPGDAQRHAVEISTRTDERGRAEVIIRDSGCGIPPELRQRVFDPFFTTRRVGEGMGLGLSIAHTIVTSLGGELELDSEPLRGTRVRVALPAASIARAAARRAPSAPPARARILIVDDEVTLGRSIQRILGRDHEVTCAVSGREALDRLEDDGPYDLILCDLMMPDMTGVTLYEQVARERPELLSRIAFMTGGDFTGMSRELLARIPNKVLEKPFPASELLALVKSVLGGQG